MNDSFVLQEVIHRSSVSMPDGDIWHVYTASCSEMENFRIRQKNDAAARLPSSNTEVNAIFDRQEVLRIVAADLLENAPANQ